MADVKQDYDIETDSVMFKKGQRFDVRAVGNAQSPWWNRTLCEVNNASGYALDSTWQPSHPVAAKGREPSKAAFRTSISTITSTPSQPHTRCSQT